jgi:hypothetical protein
MLDKFTGVTPAPDGKHVLVAGNVSNQQDVIAVPKEEVMNLVMALMTGISQCDQVDGTTDATRLIPTEAFEIGADDDGNGLLRMGVPGGAYLDFDLKPGMIEVIRDTFLKQMPADTAPSRH